ncbi:unnamed protein product [Moneuplotes crassus]|uniref:Uncharacterized protein n=1 Tax=Euplotes crassus TaxID=5936 RepID=A0AAD1UHG6_EUPCR|nr:unnamed protein product [Moneuplotes crassus]
MIVINLCDEEEKGERPVSIKKEKIKTEYERVILSESEKYISLKGSAPKLVDSYIRLLEYSYEFEPSENKYVEILEDIITELQNGCPENKLMQTKTDSISKVDVKVDDSSHQCDPIEFYSLILDIFKFLMPKLKDLRLNMILQYKRIISTITSCWQYLTWNPEPPCSGPAFKRVKKELSKEEDQSDQLKPDIPDSKAQSLKERLDTDLRLYLEDMYKGALHVKTEKEELSQPEDLLISNLKKNLNLIEMEKYRADKLYEIKIKQFKAKLKNRKNHKNSRRQRDNKRYKKLDPKLFIEIFHDTSRNLNHEQKKREFYKKLNPQKRKIFEEWDMRGYNRPIDIRERPGFKQEPGVPVRSNIFFDKIKAEEIKQNMKKEETESDNICQWYVEDTTEPS